MPIKEQKQLVKIEGETFKMMGSGGLEKQQLELINKPTPKSWIKQRKGRGNRSYDYVPGQICKKVLNTLFGFRWRFEVVKEEVDFQSQQVYVKGRLTLPILMPDGSLVSKDQFAGKEIQYPNEEVWDTITVNDPKTGQPKQEKRKTKIKGLIPISIGDELKGAATLCLVKCASELGLFYDVYASEYYVQYELPSEPVIEMPSEQEVFYEKVVNAVNNLTGEAKNQAIDNACETDELTAEQKEELKKLKIKQDEKN